MGQFSSSFYRELSPNTQCIHYDSTLKLKLSAFEAMKTAHMTLLHMQMHPRLISLQHFRSAPRPIAHTRSSNVAHPRLLVVAMAQKQQPLTSAERKAKKAEAQRLGKALVSVNLGQKGMTTAFLQDMANAISRNELVKVRKNRTATLIFVQHSLSKRCSRHNNCTSP